MVVQTGKTRDTKVREEVQQYFYWKSFVQSRLKPDFVTTFVAAGRAKRRPSFIEIKKGLEQGYYKQILSYLWKWHSDRESFIRLLQETIDKQPILVYKIVKELPELEKAKPSINILYVNQNSVEILLGDKGKIILEKVLNLINNLATESNWPLTKIYICYTRDFEVKNWEYILVDLVFNCKFETANEYLEEIYSRIDNLIENFSSQERELIANLIYLDIETNKDVPSS